MTSPRLKTLHVHYHESETWVTPGERCFFRFINYLRGVRLSVA
jgi:hypothetical protein